LTALSGKGTADKIQKQLPFHNGVIEIGSQPKHSGGDGNWMTSRQHNSTQIRMKHVLSSISNQQLQSNQLQTGKLL